MFLSDDGRARGIARAYRPCCEVVLPSVAVGAAARGLKRGVCGMSGLCPCRVPVTGGCSLLLPMACWWWASTDGLFSASADDEVPVSVGRRFFGIMPVPRDLLWARELADSPISNAHFACYAKPRMPCNAWLPGCLCGGYEIPPESPLTLCFQTYCRRQRRTLTCLFTHLSALIRVPIYRLDKLLSYISFLTG